MADSLPDTPQKILTGRRVLVYILLFFGVIAIVNAIFITKAIQTNSGIVNESPYERGLGYNKILEKHAQEQALGWKGMTAVEDDTRFIYRLVDKDGRPVTGAKVSVVMVRPVQKGYDFPVVLQDAGDGRYVGTVDAPLKGAWNAHISVVRGSESYSDMAPLVLQ